MILQASSGGACRSLAALIILPFFSASSRSGMKPFWQACAWAGLPPCCDGGAADKDPGPPAIGAAPPENGAAAGGAPTLALGDAPLTGGKAGSLAAGPACCPGSGAGNAPCASAECAWTER